MNKKGGKKLKLKLEALKQRSPAWRELIEKYEQVYPVWIEKWKEFKYQLDLALFYGSYLFKL